MKAERQRTPCYVCEAAPIRRICLADQIVSQGKYLFCDNCRKHQALRKHASQIYEIDSYSAPLSLLSINSTQMQLATEVFQKVKSCRKSIETRSIPTFDLLMSIEDKILKKMQQLNSTFDSETSQIFQQQLKDHLPQSRQQILKKVMTLKWLKQNKDIISNAPVLYEKIAIFSKAFNQGIEILFFKIENLLDDFFVQFNVDNFFTQIKRQQKNADTQNQTLTVKNTKKVIKQNIKPSMKKPSLTEEKPKIERTELMKQKVEREQQRMQLQNQVPYVNIFNNPKSKQNINPPKDLSFERLIFPLHAVKQDRNEQSQKQKQSSENKISESKPIKKKSWTKPVPKSQKSIIQQELVNKPPPLILQSVPKKQDYLDEEKLVINLKNIAQVFWMLNQEEKNQKTSSPIKEPKIKYENGSEKIVQQKKQPRNSIDPNKTIKIQSIKYLQVQELPKRMVEMFTVTIDGRQTKVKYSLQKLYEKINLMENLQQIHIFSSILFSNQTDILTMIFTCPNIKVLVFSCFNSVSKMLPKFKEMIGDQINEEIKVLEIAGNIPYWENIEIADVKLYFPESEKNKKITDEKFSNNFEQQIEGEKKCLEGHFNQKEMFENRNACWFIPHDRTRVEGERNYRILEPHENKLLAECFKQLRSCWIPYLTTERLTEKQEISNIEKIQNLALGFHYFVLQPIPQKFYFADKNIPHSPPFCKSLINLKSINLINLNINDFFMRSRFCPNWKNVLSLRIENCIGLTNQFYKNLPKFCPKLRKICVNNLEPGIEGDFLTKLECLETIILPWSQLSYKRSEKIDEIQKGQKPLGKEGPQVNGNGVIKLFNLKKWRYVNLYGCSWFHTDFFVLMQPESLQHLNMGKCPKLNIQDLVYYLQRFTSLQSLCLDQLELSNKDLFNILKHLPNLTRLSIANCPAIDLSFGKLDPEELQILDRMTHLDVRNKLNSIAHQYTMKMVNPKYLIMSRGFELEQNQPETLAKRQITGCSASY